MGVDADGGEGTLLRIRTSVPRLAAFSFLLLPLPHSNFCRHSLSCDVFSLDTNHAFHPHITAPPPQHHARSIQRLESPSSCVAAAQPKAFFHPLRSLATCSGALIRLPNP